MKLKSFFVAALLTRAIGADAALPNPLMFNTAINNTYSGLVGVNNAGSNWQVSLTNITGPYVYAKQASVAGWIASPDPLADWVTYPSHGCSGATNLAEHWCLGPSAANPGGVRGDVEEFYKISFELPAYVCGTDITQTGVYNLAIKFFADNIVYKVYINGNLFWTNGGFTSPYNSNDNHSNVLYGQALNLNQYWQAGTNDVIVEVRSGAPGGVGWTGFMAVVDQVNTTHEPCGEDPQPCCLGNFCGANKNYLYANYEVPLNSNNFFFSGDVQRTDKVNVGLPCSTLFPGKFNVTTANPSDPAAGNDSYSIYGTNTNLLNNSTNTGVYGSAVVQGGEEGGIRRERGVWGNASGGLDARGVFGKGELGLNSYGGYFESTSQNQGTNYGVYAIAANGSANNWAGYFDGDVEITGNGWVNGATVIISDRRYKTNIKELSNISEKLKQLKGYTYDFKTEEFKNKNFPKTQQIGFIAQELKEVFPQLVLEGKDGYFGVNYMGFIPVLLQANKEQQARIDQQQQQIDELKSMVQSLALNTSNTTGNPASGTINLSDKNAIVLNQNVPNPFAESTVITYNIPAGFSKAQIIFTTNEGKVIKTYEITTKGEGNLNVFASDLSRGIYSYSLVIDGKTVETKKMIKD